jgi:hypothetical protein
MLGSSTGVVSGYRKSTTVEEECRSPRIAQPATKLRHIDQQYSDVFDQFLHYQLLVLFCVRVFFNLKTDNIPIETSNRVPNKMTVTVTVT